MYVAITRAKTELYISPSADLGGAAFSVNDIQSVTYHTNNHANVSPTDFYMTLYTAGTAHGWYGQRITAEPYLKTVQPYTPVNDVWQSWSTGGLGAASKSAMRSTSVSMSAGG